MQVASIPQSRPSFPTQRVKRFLDTTKDVLVADIGYFPEGWPNDWCMDTCFVLFPELRKILRGWRPNMVSGYFYVPTPYGHYAWGEYGHVWIQCSNGTIIDPTASQFFPLATTYAIWSPRHRAQGRYSRKPSGR